MPQWAGSCWYYLRYIDPKNNNNLINEEKEKYWMKPKGVDVYVGGAEHATRHLLYARFWHKFLYDINVVSTKEPFFKLQHVGLIKGSDDRKMSKRWGNVINPDDVIKQFGVDAFRMYEMFMGPFADSISWNTAGVKGTKRFLDRVWDLYQYVILQQDKLEIKKSSNIDQLVQLITDQIDNFKFNTAISSLMKYFNERDFAPKININGEFEDKYFDKKAMETFLILLSPFAPHITEELWIQLGNNQSIFKAKWPEVKHISRQNIANIPVMINGKKRTLLKVDISIKRDDLFKLAMKDKNVLKFISTKKIKKTIYIPGKILSIVL